MKLFSRFKKKQKPTRDKKIYTGNTSFTVVYIENNPETEINNFITANHQQIIDIFKAKEFEFYYLPVLLQSEYFREIVGYNRPYLNVTQRDDSFSVQAKFSHEIIKLNNLNFQCGALVWFDPEKPLRITKFKILDESNNLLPQFEEFAQTIEDIHLSTITPYVDDGIRFREIFPEKELYIPDLMSNDVSELASDEVIYESTNANYLIQRKENQPEPDELFDNEAFQIACEIISRLELLREKGFTQLIGQIIEEQQAATFQISRLLITKDFRIFLKDYDMREVIMAPLSKSLFILFLRHPEGIIFKQLGNYRDELLSIYREFSLREKPDSIIESIDAMVDPLSNSVNEKCSRIRSAFLEIVADKLAQNYYVSGRRGEAKRIILDRSLVEYQ